jgi:hypothetical protein
VRLHIDASKAADVTCQGRWAIVVRVVAGDDLALLGERDVDRAGA